MKKSVADEWVKALRSGEYKQGRAQLRSKKDKFCCLGVLCDVYVKETKKGRWIVDEDGDKGFNFKSQNTLPPRSVERWASLDACSSGDFVDFNDSDRQSFKTIANYIEKNWKKL
jgi:hypothetical protein